MGETGNDERRKITVEARWVPTGTERRDCIRCGHTHSPRELRVDGWSLATITAQWHLCDAEGCPCTNLRTDK